LFKKSRLIIITTAVIICITACIPVSPQSSTTPIPTEVAPSTPMTPPQKVPVKTATKADLVNALQDLREAMLKKLDSDIDITATAFTNVKDYRRTKRWADIFTAPLRIMEDTVNLVAKIVDLKSMSEKADVALDNSQTSLQILTFVMMLGELKEVGEKLQFGLDGPTYISSVRAMLAAADATFIPPSGGADWPKSYKDVIENNLYGSDQRAPLIIPRKSTAATRKNIEFAKGALKVRSSISQTFNNLITEIEGKELPQNFPLEGVISQIVEVKKQVTASMGFNSDVRYKCFLDGKETDVETKLGAVGGLYVVFGQVAGFVDKKLQVEQTVEVLKLVQTGVNASLITVTYIIPGLSGLAEPIKVGQMGYTGIVAIAGSQNKKFYSDTEKQFYMLPQEMLVSLPTELSNLWMIADDTDQYLKYLVAINSTIPPHPEPTPLPKPTQINKIAFVSTRDGNGKIYTMNSDGSNQTQLIKSEARYPAFSREGTRIAFSSLVGAHADIYVMNIDGSNQINLSNTSGFDELFPTWSPDGTRIAFTSSYGNKYEICIMNADGSNLRRLVTYPPGGWYPAWSPDGSKVAFATNGFASSKNEGIYIINADGSNLRKLTADSTEDRCPTWSPDSKRIAFSSTRNGKWQIYVMNADVSSQLRLTNNSANDYDPTWSPDGSMIAFESDRDGNMEIYVMNADGSKQTRLTINPAIDERPTWMLSTPTLTPTPVPVLVPAPTTTPEPRLNAGIVTGRTLYDGAPVANIPVELYIQANRQLYRSIVTDTHGEFVFSKVPWGDYYVRPIAIQPLFSGFQMSGSAVFTLSSTSPTFNMDFLMLKKIHLLKPFDNRDNDPYPYVYPGTTLSIEWEPFPNAREYWVQLSIEEPWTLVSSSRTSDNKMTVTTALEPGKTYHCQVGAQSNNGDIAQYNFYFNIDAFQAQSSQTNYSLYVTTQGQGSVSLNPSGGSYASGTRVTLTANAGSGWQFSGWNGGLTGSQNPATITMTSAKSITASFNQVMSPPLPAPLPEPIILPNPLGR